MSPKNFSTQKAPSFWVDPDQPFKVVDWPTAPAQPVDPKILKKQLKSLTAQFASLQRKLYAQNQTSLLLIFQAMDAAGKDSTIRAVTKGVNPAGFQVSSFKQPSSLELDHDFLWRSAVRLPERGRIGIFNRSYYEETLVVRVHPQYLLGQKLPVHADLDQLWAERYTSMIEHERHLARNGTVVLKFWLNVSPQEQKRRFLSRLNDPKKYWKFSAGDLKERALWNDYMHAYESMIDATSQHFAPWYAIPADNKLWMRVQVAGIIVDKLLNLKLTYPQADTADFAKYRAQLETE